MHQRTPQPGDLCERLRRSRLGPVSQQLSKYLARRGYSSSTTHQYLAAVEHFARWLGSRVISHTAIERFVRRHLPACRCEPPVMCNINCVRAALNRLRELLRISRPALCERLRVDAGMRPVLIEYERHLCDVRGLAASTIHFRMTNAAAMLMAFGTRRTRDLQSVTAAMVTRFITRRLRGRSRAGSGAITSATRLFLRFLLLQGYLDRDLTGAVLSPATWRLAGLPPTLDGCVLERLVATCESGSGIASPVDSRDRAILLCMIDLGIRASDVAGLRVAGVDLTRRTLMLHQPKVRHGHTVPMTGRLSEAIQAYLPLRQSQPPQGPTDDHHFFVKHRAPAGQSLAPNGIRNVVRRRACRAGVQDQVTGTHIIRHAVASALLRRGASMKQIADLLGHRSIDTTSIYAKVDIDALAVVALPWPVPCEPVTREVAS